MYRERFKDSSRGMSFTLKKSNGVLAVIFKLRETTCVCLRTRRIDSYAKKVMSVYPVPRVSDLALHFGTTGRKNSSGDRRQLPESTETEIPTVDEGGSAQSGR